MSVWKEDVRVWHPRQSWIWEPGGLGVFDPGINALSVVTRILPRPFFLTKADLSFPENCQTPIAADLAFTDSTGIPIRAQFDWRQTGPHIREVHIETDSGRLSLTESGGRLVQSGQTVIDEKRFEYSGIYRRFVELIANILVRFRPLSIVSCRRFLHARPPSRRRTFPQLSMKFPLPGTLRELFGYLPDGTAVEAVTLRGDNGFEVRLITYGAVIQSIFAPDRAGCVADVVLGRVSAANYAEVRRFLGATIGRYANRIANGTFELDGQRFDLSLNDAGGVNSFCRPRPSTTLE